MMIKQENEVEIDLVNFDRYMEYLSIEAEMTSLHEKANEICVESMHSALFDEKYQMAYILAKKLEESSVFTNRDKIEECYKICAEHGIPEALIYQMEKYVAEDKEEVKPEAFPYLYQLARLGYTKSFRWLADCYSQGIGCDRDLYKSECLYLEGMIFDCDEYCRKTYANLNPEIEEYSGEDPLMLAIKTIVCSINEEKVDYKRTKIAKLILEGKLKEYMPESAIAILKSTGLTYNGITEYLTGQCVLYGIGTKKEPLVAEYILKEAVNCLEYELKHWDDFMSVNNRIRRYAFKKDFYIYALDSAKIFLNQAIINITKLDTGYIDRVYNGILDDLTIQIAFNEWSKTKPLFIKRAVNYLRNETSHE